MLQKHILKISILTSVCLHLMMYGSFPVLWSQSTNKKNDPPPKIYEFTIHKKTATKTTTKKEKASTQTKLTKANPLRRTKSYIPKYDFSGSKNISSHQGGSLKISNQNTEEIIEENFAEAGAMDFITATSYLPSLKKINERIENLLVYPIDFQHAYLFGKFQVHFEVTEKGQILNNVSVSGGDELLVGFTLFTLKKALSKPLPKKLYFKKPLRLTAQFNFSLSIDNGTSIMGEPSLDLQFKNYMSFARRGNAPNRVNQWAKEVLWRKIPPIIPFAGGIGVDVLALIDYIENYGKVLPGELRQFRLDKLRDKLEKNLATI